RGLGSLAFQILPTGAGLAVDVPPVPGVDVAAELLQGQEGSAGRGFAPLHSFGGHQRGLGWLGTAGSFGSGAGAVREGWEFGGPERPVGRLVWAGGGVGFAPLPP